MDKLSILNVDAEYLGKGRIVSKTNAHCIRLLKKTNTQMSLSRVIAKQDIGFFNSDTEAVSFKRPSSYADEVCRNQVMRGTR